MQQSQLFPSTVRFTVIEIQGTGDSSEQHALVQEKTETLFLW